MSAIIKPPYWMRLSKGHPLAHDLVGCWLLNEGTGSKIYDLSGHGLTLTGGGDLGAGGSPTWVPGKFGTAAKFVAASNQYFETDKSTVTGYPFTIACWFMVDDVSADYGLMFICDKDETDIQVRLAVLGTETGDPLNVRVRQGNFEDAQTSNSVLANTWHLAVGVFAGDNDRRVYLDADIGNRGINTDFQSFPPGFDRATLGRYSDATPGKELNGKISVAYIWDRELSEAEIAMLYREPFCMFNIAVRPQLMGVSQAVISVAGSINAQSAASATSELISVRPKIEINWLKEALFNGMTTNAFKLGTCLTLGWFWVRIAGCSALFRGLSIDKMDFANILTVAGKSCCNISPPSYFPHNSSTTYFYVVRRLNNCGYLELTLAAAVKVPIDAGGDLEKPQPNKVYALRIKQADGNKIQLTWFYSPIEQKSPPKCFNIYYDNGIGQVDYENPLATINYKGQKFYSYQSDVLEVGRYLFVIKTQDADGIENHSLAQLSIQLNTENPNQVEILNAESL